MTFWSAGGRQARAVLREGESASQLPQCSVGAVSLQPVEQQQQRSDVSDHPPSDRSLDSTSRISAWVVAVICCLVFVFFKRSGGAFRAPSIISVALSLPLSLSHSPPPPPTLLFLSSRRSRSPQMIREQVTCGEHFSPRTEESGDGHGGDVRPA